MIRLAFTACAALLACGAALSQVTLIGRQNVSGAELGAPAAAKSRPAFDAEAIGRGNSATRPELADTVWMTAATRDPGVALAHELAHVLMDSGEHSEEEGNLMGEETSPRGVSLSAAQCARLRETGGRNGLLEKNR